MPLRSPQSFDTDAERYAYGILVIGPIAMGYDNEELRELGDAQELANLLADEDDQLMLSAFAWLRTPGQAQAIREQLRAGIANELINQILRDEL